MAEKRTTIPPKLKEKIWKTYIGNSIESKCPICEQNVITAFSFEAGHVVSEANGGSLDLPNLRAICGSCNSSMGKKDLRDYTKEFYSNSPILLTFENVSTSPSKDVKLCTKCHINVPNLSYKWCQQCYENFKTKPKICTNCKTNIANISYKWCQKCYEKFKTEFTNKETTINNQTNVESVVINDIFENKKTDSSIRCEKKEEPEKVVLGYNMSRRESRPMRITSIKKTSKKNGDWSYRFGGVDVDYGDIMSRPCNEYEATEMSSKLSMPITLVLNITEKKPKFSTNTKNNAGSNFEISQLTIAKLKQLCIYHRIDFNQSDKKAILIEKMATTSKKMILDHINTNNKFMFECCKILGKVYPKTGKKCPDKKFPDSESSVLIKDEWFEIKFVHIFFSDTAIFRKNIDCDNGKTHCSACKKIRYLTEYKNEFYVD